MAKPYPDAVKFIIETWNSQNITFEKLAEMVTKNSVSKSQRPPCDIDIFSIDDHIIDKIQQAEGE